MNKMYTYESLLFSIEYQEYSSSETTSCVSGC